MNISNCLIQLRRSRLAAPLKSLLPRSFREACWKITQKQTEFEIMGSRMFIPLDSRNRDIILDSYEPGVSNCIRTLLKPGMIFCDVGANLGVFTLLASRLVGPKGKVFAFEPVPANYSILHENVRLNGLENIVLIEKAVSNENGVTKIYLSNYCGSHSISSEPLHYAGSFLELEMVRLDSVPIIQRIDLLKIDVEGAELEVLSGLGRLHVANIILEYNEERMAKRGLSGTGFLDELRQLGYGRITNIDDESAGLKPLLCGEQTTVNLLISPANAPVEP